MKRLWIFGGLIAAGAIGLWSIGDFTRGQRDPRDRTAVDGVVDPPTGAGADSRSDDAEGAASAILDPGVDVDPESSTSASAPPEPSGAAITVIVFPAGPNTEVELRRERADGDPVERKAGSNVQFPVNPRGIYAVRARSPEGASDWAEPVFAGQRVQLTLSPYSRAVGQVRDPEGKPVAARIEVAGVSTRSNPDDGSFELTRVPPGRHSIEVTAIARRHESAHFGSVRFDPGETRELPVTLEPLIEITGFVFDAATREPIAGAKVGAHGAALSTITDEAGAYRLWADLDRYRFAQIVTSKPGYATQHLRSALDHGAVEIYLTRGIPVTGRVIDPDGEPVEGASVAIDNRTTVARDTTDAEGRFAIDLLAPRDELWIAVHANGYVRDRFIAGAPAADLVLQLRPEAVLVVQLLDADTGRPVPRESLRIVPVVDPEDSHASEVDGNRHARTDARGYAIFRGLEPGTYREILCAPEDEQFVLEAGISTLELTRDAIPSDFLIGKVLLEGQPVSDARVSVGGSSSSSTGYTDDFGEFALNLRAASSGGWLRVTPPIEHQRRTLPYRSRSWKRSEELVIELSPAASLRGRVLWEGAPEPRTRISITSSTYASAGQVDELGYFEVDVPTDIPWTFFAMAPSLQAQVEFESVDQVPDPWVVTLEPR